MKNGDVELRHWSSDFGWAIFILCPVLGRIRDTVWIDLWADGEGWLTAVLKSDEWSLGQAGSSWSKDLDFMNSCAHGQDVFGRVGRDWREGGGLPVALLPPCLLRVDPSVALSVTCIPLHPSDIILKVQKLWQRKRCRNFGGQLTHLRCWWC